MYGRPCRDGHIGLGKGAGKKCREKVLGKVAGKSCREKVPGKGAGVGNLTDEPLGMR